MNPNTMCVSCMEQDSGDPICPTCGRPFELEAKNSLLLKPRTVLRDQYLIGRSLGHGGFGITYLAWDLGLEARLAVKEYMPNGVAGRAAGDTKVLAYSDQTQPEFEWGLDRFLEEARVLKKFNNHPGIVRVDTIFRDNGTAYLVMEYLDGMTFEEFLKRRDGKIAFETALRVILPVIDALRDVHREGILHRDISPDNIYLTKAGLVKLIDFGAARNALGQKSRNLSIILKEGYAPEEQYRASGIQGPWTDVYATAATLYHSLTGKIPQPALDRFQADDIVHPPSQLGVAIEPHAEAALMRALSVRAADRYQSMEDFKAGLTGAIDVAATTRAITKNDPRIQALGPPPARPPAPPPPPPPNPFAQGPQQSYPQQPYSQGTGPGMMPPPPPPASMRMGSSTPRWMWPSILGVAAVLSIGALVMIKPNIGGDTKKDEKKEEKKDVYNDDKKDVVKDENKDVPKDDKKEAAKDENKDVPKDDEKKGVARNDYKEPQQDKQPDRTKDDKKGVGFQNDKGYSPNNDTPPPDDRKGSPSGYQGLVQQAKQIQLRNANQAVQWLNQAIGLDPERPVAYDALAEVQLYQLHDLGDAVQNYKKALERGGEATFHVYHDHGGSNFSRNCRGWLRVSPRGVRFEGFDSLHKFSGSHAEIFEAKKNRWSGGSIFIGGGGRTATVDPNAFHIRLQGKDGPNYNLAPMSGFGEAERNLILDILGK